MMQPLWKIIWQFLKNVNIHLQYDPTIPLLGIFLRERKTHVHTKTYTQMLTAALFVIAPSWKQHKYSSVDERKNYDKFIHWNINQ